VTIGASVEPSLLPGDAVLDPVDLDTAAQSVVARALAEDLSRDGDVTSEAIIPPQSIGRAEVVARAEGILAGVGLVATVYDQVDPRVSVELHASDGDPIRRGQVLGVIAGPLRSILTGERTALNLVTHLSGIATVTRIHVDAVAGTGCAIRDTRKTMPGMRLLEKAAVRAGGGVNHRIGLFDALLVKDNHVAVAGSVAAATRAALERAGGRHVQVEVDTLAQLDEAVQAGARDVLLDNFTTDAVRRAVERARQLSEELGERILLEASGTIRLTSVRAYAETGVDRIAIGAVTHSAPQLDIALDIRTAEQEA
jgi:nicotinate-nucleotide pyrophosphorylase (carboxylating)